MKALLRNRRGSIQPNMTPMIDVVFLLIIFFLVSSHLARQEVQAELDLPIAMSGEEDPQTEQPRITINLIATDGNYEIRLGSLPVAVEELSERLASEVARSSDHLEVRIRGDRNAPYKIVSPILAACARQGLWNVSFVVIRPEDAPN